MFGLFSSILNGALLSYVGKVSGPVLNAGSVPRNGVRKLGSLYRRFLPCHHSYKFTRGKRFPINRFAHALFLGLYPFFAYLLLLIPAFFMKGLFPSPSTEIAAKVWVWTISLPTGIKRKNMTRNDSALCKTFSGLLLKISVWLSLCRIWQNFTIHA